MDSARITELLRPFLETPLTAAQLEQISTYIDLLLRWNQRVNLTAIRDPQEIVTRHFGESLFAARHLFPRGMDTPARDSASSLPPPFTTPPASCHSDTRAQRPEEESAVSLHSGRPGSASSRTHRGQDFANDQRPTFACPEAREGTKDSFPRKQCHHARLVDIGSGAGFPGLPIKIWSPRVHVTLIESRQKKVVFLREVIRTLTLTEIDVFPGRAEDFPAGTADAVTLRAVERFDQVLPVAANRLALSGTLALLIGESQAPTARNLVPQLAWSEPIPIPESTSRIVLLGTKSQ